MKKLIKYIKEFNKKTIAVIGDIMVDKYIYGKVERISPEAPVPVVNVEKEIYLPGGAANVSNNLVSLGAKTILFGVVGNDLRGEKLISDLNSRGIDTSGILVDESRQTTIKTRIIAHNQQVVRVDQENRHQISQETTQKILNILTERLNSINAIIVSDYAKGVISREMILKLLNLKRKYSLHLMIDPHIEHFKLYKNVTAITPNLQEAISGMRYPSIKGEEEIIQLGKKIIDTLKCEILIITRGEKGMMIFEKKGDIKNIPTKAKEVYDVTGAGDTVIAVFTLAFVSGAGSFEAAEISNYAAGVVVGKLGTATLTIEELKNAILS